MLNRARSVGIEFQLYLVRYACERFLYRLGQSEVRNRLILKGGTLLSLWMPEPFRSTRDIDMLAFDENREEAIRAAISAICAVPCPEDGLEFDVDTLRVSPIREGQSYGGQRATLTALLGNARATVRIDFGAFRVDVRPHMVVPTPFHLRGPEVYWFDCKTRRRPYDLLVMAAMIALKHHLGDSMIAESSGR